ncbi:hypothetical protein LXA43DRAFT_390071 [Ganoderma leucocontextum]|nr:hypothetical protein LXA43DRAFT_390071 [Ganoderma leucocontextum]
MSTARAHHARRHRHLTGNISPHRIYLRRHTASTIRHSSFLGSPGPGSSSFPSPSGDRLKPPLPAYFRPPTGSPRRVASAVRTFCVPCSPSPPSHTHPPPLIREAHASPSGLRVARTIQYCSRAPSDSGVGAWEALNQTPQAACGRSGHRAPSPSPARASFVSRQVPQAVPTHRGAGASSIKNKKKTLSLIARGAPERYIL